MKNREILIGIVEAMSLTNEQVQECLTFGNNPISDDELNLILSDNESECLLEILEAFLNGIITFKRGPKEETSSKKKKIAPLSRKGINNVVMKKLKIALNLTNDDLVDVFSLVPYHISRGDLTTFFRKEGHKHYKKVDDHLLSRFFIGIEKTLN